ncbi:MAG TPA: hypothetical protein VJ813_10015 [Vicinamibacterales bacterium]|nr:hypothetical protein [Vicinamibacterales bacterium]
MIVRNTACTRENELLEALQASRWPDACDAALRDHVTECASCTDLLDVVGPLLDDQQVLLQEAPVPSSAIVWWRAQMRSRREAVRRAAQPISFVQGIAIACAAGLLATALGIFVPTFRKSLTWMLDAAAAWSGLSVPVAADQLASPIVLAGILAFGLCALLLPVALYFTFHED